MWKMPDDSEWSFTYTGEPFDDALADAAGEVDHREAMVDAQRMGAVIGAYMAEVMKQIPLPAALPLALQYQGSLLHPTAVIHLTGDDDDEDDYAGSY